MRGETSRDARERRALNIIWTAAGDYGFRPEFMAFQQDGAPDLYLNSIVGLVHRCYDCEKLSRALHSFDDSLLRDVFTDLFWIGLEHAAYERTLPSRPALSDLRREHARQWLRDDTDHSMQQLMMRSEVVHDMKRGRCREILGAASGLHNPWDKGLFAALHFPGDMETDGLIQAMADLWKKYFVFHYANLRRRRIHLLLGPRWTALLRKILPFQREYAPDLSLSRCPTDEGRTEGSAGRKEYSLSGGACGKREKELRELFGPPLFDEGRRRDLERELCRGSHEGTRLWITGGRKSFQPRNLAWYSSHRLQYRTEAARLGERLRNAFAVLRQPGEIVAREGRLCSPRAWRASCLGDTRVFSRGEDAPRIDISLFLLLDASASRESRQEIIACEAYALAEGASRAGIPIAIASFCSVYGYTVLERLKDYAESEGRGALRYIARGWNRDGLAIRTLPKLMENARGKRLVAVLTDAYPSDEADIPGHGLQFSQCYIQEPAVEDTAKAVRELRQQGIQVVGILNSLFSSDIVEDYAKRIYGTRYVRLENTSRLADAVGGLLEDAIASAACGAGDA